MFCGPHFSSALSLGIALQLRLEEMLSRLSDPTDPEQKDELRKAAMLSSDYNQTFESLSRMFWRL
jgi:hypothetical protein